MDFELETKNFSLKDTLTCGQCFRFKAVDSDSFLVFAGKNSAVISQKKSVLEFKFSTCGLDFWENYLDLNYNYDQLLSDFRGKGAAVCTEYSAMAQNIMTIFGLKTEMLMGRRHAYNMLFENGEVSVVDFTDHVKIYDIKYNLLEEIPFVVSIGEYDPVKYYEFIYGNRQLVIGNYDVVRFSSFDCVVEDELDRIYNADGGLVLKKK